MKSLGLQVEEPEETLSDGLEIVPELPEYSPDQEYYKEYFRLFLQNENLIADIDQIATENFKVERKIMCIEDFYENTLIP